MARGRKPKMTAEELRFQLIETGIRSLRDKGMFDGLKAIHLDTAIAASGAPRVAAYREFQNQQNFRLAVLKQILEQTPVSKGLDQTVSIANKLVKQHGTGLQSTKSEIANAARRQIIRTLTKESFSQIDGSRRWKIYRAAVATAQTDPNLTPELEEAIRIGESNLIKNYALFYEFMAPKMGLEIQPGAKPENFALSVYALLEGLANRTNPALTKEDSTQQPEHQSPALLAIGFEAILYQFYQPIEPETKQPGQQSNRKLSHQSEGFKP